MFSRSKTSILILIALAASVFSAPAIGLSDDKPVAAGGTQSASLLQRIDFGNAHIMGQTIKSGAVYLMHRKKSNIDSMLNARQNYRAEIMEEYGLENTALAPGDKQSAQNKNK